jgi:hypothetical protein
VALNQMANMHFPVERVTGIIDGIYNIYIYIYIYIVSMSILVSSKRNWDV